MRRLVLRITCTFHYQMRRIQVYSRLALLLTAMHQQNNSSERYILLRTMQELFFILSLTCLYISNILYVI